MKTEKKGTIKEQLSYTNKNTKNTTIVTLFNNRATKNLKNRVVLTIYKESTDKVLTSIVFERDTINVLIEMLDDIIKK